MRALTAQPPSIWHQAYRGRGLEYFSLGVDLIAEGYDKQDDKPAVVDYQPAGVRALDRKANAKERKRHE